MAIDLSVNVNTQKAIAALDQLANKAKQIEEKFGGAFDRINNYALGLQATFAGLATITAKFADELADVAAANDTTIASVLALDAALESSGGQAGNAGKLFQSLANNIEAANAGNLKTVSTFEQLGVTISDLGNLGQEAIRDKLLKALSEIQDPATRNARAVELFGKSMQGVDIRQFVADLEANKTKYEEFGPALKTASDAVGSLEVIVKNLKLAFAQTFEPVFKYIANLKISVEDLIVPLKLAAAAMVAMVSASVIGGLVKVIGLMKTLTTVVSRNPLITIAAALVSLGTAAVSYLGITKAMEDAQDEVNSKVDEQVPKVQAVVREQSGLNDVIQKQKESLSRIGDQLELNFKKSLDNLKSQNEYLNLSETERKVREAIAKIDEETATKKLALQEEFSKRTKEEQARLLDSYNEQIKRVDDLAAAQKSQTEQAIRAGQQQRSDLDLLTRVSKTYTDNQVKNFEAISRSILDRAGVMERIDAEQKLTQLSELRAELNSSIAKLSEKDRQEGARAIADITTNVDLLGKGYQEINDTIAEGIRLKVADGQISKAVGDEILASLRSSGRVIADANKVIGTNTKEITRQSRSFQEGWEKAFNRYRDAAKDAASYAQRMFDKTMQGIEDLIVDFVKTGKFEWKSFVASMAEELLRSNIKKLLADVLNPNTGLLGGVGQLFSGLFGETGGQQRGNSPNSPLYVADVTGGGGAGNILGIQGNNPLIPGGGIGGGSSPIGGIWDTVKNVGSSISNVFGGVVDAVGNVGSGIWDTVSSIGSSIGDLFGGWFADGGTLGAGKWGIAGERGPELITGPASITPISGSTNVTYNINAVDAMSFKQMIAQDPSFIYAVTMQGAKGIPSRR